MVNKKENWKLVKERMGEMVEPMVGQVCNDQHECWTEWIPLSEARQNRLLEDGMKYKCPMCNVEMSDDEYGTHPVCNDCVESAIGWYQTLEGIKELYADAKKNQWREEVRLNTVIQWLLTPSEIEQAVLYWLEQTGIDDKAKKNVREYLEWDDEYLMEKVMS